MLKSWNPYMLQVYKYHALPDHHSSFKAPTRLPQASLLSTHRLHMSDITPQLFHVQDTLVTLESTLHLFCLTFFWKLCFLLQNKLFIPSN